MKDIVLLVKVSNGYAIFNVPEAEGEEFVLSGTPECVFTSFATLAKHLSKEFIPPKMASNTKGRKRGPKKKD